MKITSKRKYFKKKTVKRKLKSKKNIKFNKYEKGKVYKNFNLIKMPYIDTELIESKYLLYPLKNIETNKESINTEQSLKDELLYIEKVEKENKLSPKKDFYTYVNYAWMKEKSIVMNYKNYYFVKLDNFRFVQNTVNYRVVNLANEYCRNNNTALSKKVQNVIDAMTYKNLKFDKLKKYIIHHKIIN